jgi:DNA repair protein RadC
MHSTHFPIRLLKEEDKPREKLLLQGRSALSDTELLAILINTGTKNKSALDIAKEILLTCHSDLNQLGKLDCKQLMHFEGMGEAKSITLISALELGRRRASTQSQKGVAISSSQSAYEIFRSNLSDLDHEEFWGLYLSSSNKIVGKKRLSQGGISGTVADLRIILRTALEFKATSFIVAHNHPSGSTKASQADIQLTNRLKKSSELMDLKLLDHLIIGDQSYLSFADEGLL